MKLYWSVIRPVLVYGCETWVLKANIQRLTVSERKLLRKISKRPTNASIVQCIGSYHTITCFGILECHNQGVRYEHAEMVPNVVGS
jgi:hypothetical protein